MKGYVIMFRCFRSQKSQSREITDTLLLCHGRKQQYTKLLSDFSKKASDLTTVDLVSCPDYTIDISNSETNISALSNKFDVIASIYCPIQIYYKQDETTTTTINETTFKNLHGMLKDDGMYFFVLPQGDYSMTKTHVNLSDDDRKTCDPRNYDFPNVNLFLNSSEITTYFNVKYVYQHELNNLLNNTHEGYIFVENDKQSKYPDSIDSTQMPDDVIEKCNAQDIDIQKWHEANQYQIIVLVKKKIIVGGSINEKHVYKGRSYKIRVGARGGRFIMVLGNKKYV
jgi:hypothetical protein